MYLLKLRRPIRANLAHFLDIARLNIFSGVSNITEKNFNHEGFYYFLRDGMSAFRGGGEFAHLTAQVGQKAAITHFPGQNLLHGYPMGHRFRLIEVLFTIYFEGL